MAHFPASLSMSRLAGSSGTQESVRGDKTSNKDPARSQVIILKSRSSSQVSRPPTLETELEGPRGPQRSECRPSLADWLNLCTVSSTEQETARAPTRELEGTSHRSVCISSVTSGRCSCRNFGTGIITLMLDGPF